MPDIDRMKAAFTMKDISPKTQLHLRNVYGNLGICTMVCALGMYMNAFTIISGFMMSVAAMISMAYMMYKVSNVNENE
jgi:hypothetical protein